MNVIMYYMMLSYVTQTERLNEATGRIGLNLNCFVEFIHTYRFNPLKHSVSGAATLTQNSQLLKYIPEISNEFFTFIAFLQITFTVLGIGLFLNSGRISA